ncbi:beta-defensin 122-like [Meriones unguiculatus]|uniref:beta-defensin 122-like n=1 Tax=Meriones unguiculatus TaxID=10047 RepID=UPI0010864295|nr:beta-defensin 122-like [Meriones unguiculatus]
MKYLHLTLLVFLILFQLFSVCRCRKACWVIRGHCRERCKSGERVKKPCNNGDYCCTASKMDPRPQAPVKTFGHNFKDYPKSMPVIFVSNYDELAFT